MRRLTWAALALLSALAASFLGLNHPLVPWVSLVAASVLAAAAAARPAWWPAWALAAWPWLGWMPWTGWLQFEELDIVLLATAAGVYAQMAFQAAPAQGVRASRGSGPSAALWLLLPLAVSVTVSAAVGVRDAGGWAWGWWQGYREPLNSLRLAKPMLWTLLLLPPCWWAWRREPEATARALLAGMLACGLGVSLTVWWERYAYTGLLDFSTDYRATGLFWEMHVGGAALDAALVMTLPFALLLALRVRRAGTLVVALLALALAVYAGLATFSRIVYLALPVGAAVVWWLVGRQQHQAGQALQGRWAWLPWALLVPALSAWLFAAGGYRSVLAWLGAVGLLLPLVDRVRPLAARTWGIGLALGLLAATAVAASAAWVPKGQYLAYAAAWLFTAGCLFRRQAGPAVIAGFLAVLAALVGVGVRWGGNEAWLPGLAAALTLGVNWLLAAGIRQPLWPSHWRWQAQTWVLMSALSLSLAVFGGGAYMTERLTQTSQDGQGRTEHWARAIGWLNGADWLVGKGLGRFASHYGLSGRTEDQVGDYRLASNPGQGSFLVITGGKHTLGSGEQFRVSQRISAPAPGALVLTAVGRAQGPVQVRAEVCEKHLLYPMNCVEREVALRPPQDAWQPLRFEMPQVQLSRGNLLAPRWITFSVALNTPGARLEMDDLDLVDSQGTHLLDNGRFEQGLAHWFTSSDRHHMPWHAKNLAVHLLVEQGLLGLLSFTALFAAALWRTAAGAARGHPLAPALAGALLALLIVGAVDSLLDMPRVAWCGLWLAASALLLPGEARPSAGSARAAL